MLGVLYPIFLVLGGLVIGFVPGVRELHIELASELVLLLPPLLYVAAFFSSLRDLRANIRPIGLLAVGLVVLTAVVVAGTAHWVVGLSWPAAFVLGAVLSPTDPRGGDGHCREARGAAPHRDAPRRREPHNDASALILLRATLGVAGGALAFSFLSLGARFVVGALVGVAIGLAMAWIIAAVRCRVQNPLVEITITLFTGYAAYLQAEELRLEMWRNFGGTGERGAMLTYGDQTEEERGPKDEPRSDGSRQEGGPVACGAVTQPDDARLRMHLPGPPGATTPRRGSKPRHGGPHGDGQAVNLAAPAE